VSWILLAALVVGGLAASTRIRGFGRIVLWSVVCFVASTLFRGGRVLVLPFLFVLILEGLYWLALPRDGGPETS
jgi:hypothetical protein